VQPPPPLPIVRHPDAPLFRKAPDDARTAESRDAATDDRPGPIVAPLEALDRQGWTLFHDEKERCR